MSEERTDDSPPGRYVRRPGTVDAVRWLGDRAAVEAVLGTCPPSAGPRRPRALLLEYYWSVHWCDPGMWLLRHPSGELVAMKDAMFRENYVLAEEERS